MTDSQNADELIAIFTDKYLYNEGDVMRIKGVLRKRSGVGQVMVQIVSLTDGKTVFTGKYPLEKDKDFLTTWKIQGSLLKPDTYQIYASVGASQISTTFEYREPGHEEQILQIEQPKRKQRVFLDSEYNPHYYIERYNNDPSFREWCEKTYPGLSIYEIVGIDEEEYAKSLQDTINQQLEEHKKSNIREDFKQVAIPSKNHLPPGEQSKNIPIPKYRSSTPNSFINRYKTDPEFQRKFDQNYPNITIEKAVGITEQAEIPNWVKNIFKSYGEDRISDTELIDVIRFLINEKIINV